MGQSTEELNTQIAGTREALADDLDALQDKVSPTAIAARQRQAAKGRVLSARDKIMGSARSARDGVENGTGSATGAVSKAVSSAGDSVGGTVEGSPIAAGLVAFGAGLVIAGLIPASRGEVEVSRRVTDAAQPLVDEARAVGQDVGVQLKDSAAESAQQLKDSAAESAQVVQDEGASSARAVRAEAPGPS